MVSGLLSFAPLGFNGFQDGFVGQKEDMLPIEGSRQQRHDLFDFQEIAEEKTGLSAGTQFCSQGGDGFLQESFSKPSLQQEAFYNHNFNFIFPENHQTSGSGGHPEKENNLRSAGSINNKETTRPSWDLLNNFGTGFNKLRTRNDGDNDARGGHQKFSTEDIIRIAGARYIQFCDLSYNDFSMVMHPFGHALSGLSEDNTRDVELVHLLLAAAEKVAYEQYERASRLLSRCEWIALERANPVQRIVYCFAEALRERMDKETGAKNLAKEQIRPPGCMAGHGLGTNLILLKLYQAVPLLQTMNFAAVQTIVENVSGASKIHMIDLEIRSGVHWTIFMQAIAERNRNPVEHLKISAVGTVGKNDLEDIGRSLATVAESLKLRFSFRAIYVQDMSEVTEKMFEVASGEAVVVYGSLILRKMIARQDCLENLMRVIKRLNPAVMVAVEVEANLNSRTYVGRFIEALFFYSAYFDCLETCMGKDTEVRACTESILHWVIQNIVATEGSDRTERCVKMEVWRAFFARFGMVEIEVSESSFYQANLVIRQSPWPDSCSLEKNGKGVAVVWKGTPIHCFSAWKFPKEKRKGFWA